MKIMDWLSDKFYNIVIRCVKMKAEVEVVSPFHPYRVTVYIDIFGKYSYEVEHYRLLLTKDLRVDIDELMERTSVHELIINYPDKWSFWRIKTLHEQKLMTEKEVKESEYPEVLDKKTIAEFERSLLNG